MAENSNKIKLLKFYELLQKDTDEDRPLSRQEPVRLLCEQGVPVGIRTIDRDIDALTKFGFEIITFKKDHEILSRGLREGMHCFTERCMIHP